ncbi:ATP-binding protein [Silanimonas sp.]|uniref:ATP-binding protein n=1 Tax=Silanimonas sp. TaxID=1929290 RepID=UPI0022C02478|nr:ATP-binding protein [Silanimonas sp.]MCZ8116242.1 ATP-binding protein [Silanimonas sp.]
MRAPVELGRREPERIGFGDIAGLEDLKRTVRLQIIEPFLKPGLFAKFRKRAATNMPWDVDPGMKRPGRFGRQVFVPPPDEAARAHIVELKLRGVPHEGIDGREVAARTRHFSGADIEGVVELAKDYVLEDHLTREVERPIRQPDLLRAAEATEATTLDWLRTARDLVRYAGADDSYRDVEAYLRQHKLV